MNGDFSVPSDPHVSVSSGSSVLVSWIQRFGNGVAQDEVRHAVYDPSTDALGTTRKTFFSDTDITDLTAIDSTVLANGQYVVVADDSPILGGSNVDSFLRFEIINADGTQPGASQAVAGTRNDGDGDFLPAVAGLAGGGFVIAWTDRDSDLDVAYQVFSSTGTPLTGVRQAGSTGSNDNDLGLDVIALPDGGFVITWSDQQDSTSKLQRFDSDGDKVGSVVTVDDDFVSQSQMALLEDGRFIATWTGTSDVSAEIFDIRDDVNPDPVYAPEAWQIGTVGRDIFTATADIVRAAAGNDVVRRSNFTVAGQDVDGGTGVDTIEGSGINYFTTVIWNLSEGTYRGITASSTQTWSNFENYVNNSSANGSETVIGTNGANIIATAAATT